MKPWSTVPRLMYGGKVCEQADVKTLFTAPCHPYTRGLIDSHPSPDYQGERLKVIPGSVPTLKKMPAGCPFHNRCSKACDLCEATFPPFEVVEGNHSLACYNWKDDEVRV